MSWPGAGNGQGTGMAAGPIGIGRVGGDEDGIEGCGGRMRVAGLDGPGFAGGGKAAVSTECG